MGPGGLGWASEDGSTVNFPTAAGGLDIAPCAGSMEFCESADDYPARHQAQVLVQASRVLLLPLGAEGGHWAMCGP